MHPPFLTDKLLKNKQIWLRGVDLNSKPALTPRKFTDFPTRQNAQNSDEGKSFIQFSFSLSQKNEFWISITIRRITIESEILNSKFALFILHEMPKNNVLPP